MGRVVLFPEVGACDCPELVAHRTCVAARICELSPDQLAIIEAAVDHVEKVTDPAILRAYQATAVEHSRLKASRCEGAYLGVVSDALDRLGRVP